ncbi:helix-turn-helix domain-containing protein [Streptomyces sp. NBC_01717]|uniref:helix-turn-helix domain-containing protein n=1 Tax=Streptomyces sp. NBC_01717 TaxID=2975918 RepID=UPI003FCDD57E
MALDAADGRVNAAIARELGAHLSTVRRRRKRFHTAGPAALQDRKRSGRRPRYGPEVHWRSWTPQLSARVHAELGQLHLRVADVSRQPGQMDPVRLKVRRNVGRWSSGRVCSDVGPSL